MVKIAVAIDVGGLPKVSTFILGVNPASDAACTAVNAAVAKRSH